MKIAMFSDTYIPNNNGVATVLASIQNTKRDFESFVIAPTDKSDIVVSGPRNPVYSDYRIVLDKHMESKIPECDVVHVHTPYTMFYYGREIAKKRKLPFVGTFHTEPAALLSMFDMSSSFGMPLAQLSWRFLVSLYKSCEVVTAPSKKTIEEINKRGIKNTVYIPNGVDIERFNPNVRATDFCEKYDINKDRNLVLFIGRLQKKKGADVFVDAALKCKTDALFLVGGKGELREKLERKAKGNDNIRFLDYVPDELLPQAYAAADLIAFPSQMETQGMVIMEAMASGKAVISTPVGIAPELLDDEFMFKLDSKSLAKKLESVMEMDIKKMGKNNRRMVERDYTLETMADRLKDLYVEVLS